MSETKRTEIGTLGEFGLIDRVTGNWPLFQQSTLTGIGDDAAVLDGGGDQAILISTDMMIEGIHFDLAYHPLGHLGYKAIIVNLSDICAMNGTPTHVLVSVGISNRFSVEAVEEIYAGIRHAWPSPISTRPAFSSPASASNFGPLRGRVFSCLMEFL
jgi:thiamine-monophosphate kinase